MAYYLVTAKPNVALLPKLRERLNSGEIQRMSPFGEAMQESLDNARVREDGYALWEEEDYCHPPLAQERAAVLDHYFSDLAVERVQQGSGWARIEELPRLWPLRHAWQETVRYKLLGQSGLRVSELCLGTITFGEDWGWGASQAESGKIFDAFASAGGNFIDTSNNYTDGTSERYVGEFTTSDRDHFVIATKYTLTERKSDPNFGGNHRKNLMRSVEGSLRRLKSDYLDLLYLHMWDGLTPVEEVIRALDDLVRAGKVLYVGMFDTPAWIVSQANMLAEWRGWSRLVALQAPYSLADRALERDLLPMAQAHQMAVLVWGVLEGGELTGKYNQPTSEPKRSQDTSEQIKSLAEELIALAAEIGRTPAQVAINWVRQQAPAIIPILGARTEKQFRENLGCLAFALSAEQVERLSAASPINLGFPHSFLSSDHVRSLICGDTYELIARSA